MGKTSKPLWLIVDTTILGFTEFATLEQQGHRVQPLSSATGDDLQEADMILSPKAWRMLPETVKYLPAAIKGARVEVYGATKKRGD